MCEFTYPLVVGSDCFIYSVGNSDRLPFFIPDCLLNYTGKTSSGVWKLHIFIVPFHDLSNLFDYAFYM